MANTVRITYFGMDGEGATLTDAKKDAGRKIEQALEGSYSPEYLTFGGNAAFMWREPSGWTYRLVHETGRLFGSSGEQDHDDMLRRVKRHLAQIADANTPEAACLAYVHREDRRELQTMFDWQRNYKQAIAAGLNDQEAREAAGGLRPMPQAA